MQLKNIISYSQFRDYYAYDYDATPYSLGGQSSRDIPVLAPNYFTEEARVEGKALHGALNYTAGFYYDNQTYIALGLPIRGWQRVAIDLAIGQQRHCVEHDDGSGHHVVGQAPNHALAQRCRIQVCRRRGCHIGNQPSGRIDHRYGVGDAMLCHQRGFHVSEFDTEAAELT